MSKLTKEALDSTDANFIKKARGVEKGKVTRCVDRILDILKVDEANSYDHKSISKIEIGEAEISLKEAFKNVEDLHNKYQWYRDEGTDAAKEEEIVNEQIEYFVTVEDKYNEALKSILKYNQAGEINSKEYLLKVAKESFEDAKKAVVSVINSEDVDVQRNASTAKEEFGKNFKNLLAHNQDYMKCLEKFSSVDGDEKIDLTKERIAASELNEKLDILIKKNQFKENQSLINNSASQILNSTMNQSKPQSDKFLKLQKISPPKFSATNWQSVRCLPILLKEFTYTYT